MHTMIAIIATKATAPATIPPIIAPLTEDLLSAEVPEGVGVSVGVLECT